MEELEERVLNWKESALNIGRGVGFATMLIDAYMLFTGTPFQEYVAQRTVLLAAKTFLDIPKLVYKGVGHVIIGTITKVPSYHAPLIGPAIDTVVCYELGKKKDKA